MIQQQPTQFKGSEMIRVLMPIIIIIIIYFIITKGWKGFKDALSSPFKSLGWMNNDAENNAIAASDKSVNKILSMPVNNPFDPNLYTKAPSGAKLITMAAANSIAQQIYDAIGTVYDTPTQIVAAFKKLSYKTQVSFLSKVFADKYKLDLFSFLTEKLDTTAQKIALGQIIDYVNSLPNGA